MITNPSFDRRLTEWLDSDAEGRVPDHLAEVLVVTRATRQRPWWSSPERWLPVDSTLRLRLAPVPRMAWALIVLALVLAIVGTIAYIGSQRKLPEAFGPAANGKLVYAAPDGDIYVFDPGSGVSSALITGIEADRRPAFSGDGSKLAFARLRSGGVELVIAAVDGTIIFSIPLAAVPTSISWAPDGTRMAIVDTSPNTFSIVAADGSASEAFDLDLKVEQVFWRPNGRELVFMGESGGASPTYGLYVVGADGEGLRSITEPVPDASDVQLPALSPDGSRVVYGNWSSGGYLFSVDVDTGIATRLRFDPLTFSDYYPSWSADGTRLVFNRGIPQQGFHLAVAPATGGVAVDIGPFREWAAGATAAFSPDGTKVIAQFSEVDVWLLDAAGGEGTRLDLDTAGEPISWQRLAR